MIEHPYPLQWPPHLLHLRHPAYSRKESRFTKKGNNGRNEKLSIADAVKRLMHEISAWTPNGHYWRIDPFEVIVSSNLHLKKDGFPRSGQSEPDDPGVTVYFKLDDTAMAIPCDTFDRVADNIAAIAGYIGNKRANERWGVSDTQAEFSGWAALEHSPCENWWDVLQVPKDSPRNVVEKSYKKLRSAYHPDRQNGDANQFQRIQKAYERFDR